MDKITKKQLSGYVKAKRETISFNDSYNLSVFGIDLSTYSRINKTISSLYGIFPTQTPNLTELNRHFANLRHVGEI